MSIRLVIVDDAPFIREVIRNLAVENGIEVVGEAQNGLDAVEVVKKTNPEVVIMDVVMPGKNGIEATKEILTIYPETRIIACSTLEQSSMILNAIQAGCCDFVRKPFKKEDLLTSIKNSVKAMV